MPFRMLPSLTIPTHCGRYLSPSASGSKTQTDVGRVDVDTYCRNVREFRVIHMAGTSPTRRLCSGLLIECYLKGVYPLQASHFTDSSFFHQALSSLKVVSLGRRRRSNFLLPLTAIAGSNRLGNGRRRGQSIHGAAAL